MNVTPGTDALAKMATEVSAVVIVASVRAGLMAVLIVKSTGDTAATVKTGGVVSGGGGAGLGTGGDAGGAGAGDEAA